ncbi:MAG: tandem-95 repeat protein, partial [Pseudomonadota bacterium]
MAGRFHPIFKHKTKVALEVPKATRPLMRVLEPRILLDAASVETALDIAGQATHSQFADAYSENLQDTSAADGGDGTGSNTGAFAEFDGTESRRTDRDIVFIDASVPDRDELIASLEADAVIHILHADQDGVQQIADILDASGGFDAVHIFSHGSSGSIGLGNTQLTLDSMQGEHADALATIGASLSDDADILLYGCNFGDGATGRAAAEALAQATGADVAASDDLTGADALSGDWDLEVHVGHVERQSYSLPDWQNILPEFQMQAVSDPVTTHVNDGIVGTPGTVATWTGAVTRDPGGGGPIETYDIRATILAVTGDATASFDTVSTTDPTLDDFRVVVTNVGEVETTIGGQDVLAEGTVTVSWDIVISGTEDPAPTDIINLVISDIDGLGGQSDSREAVRVDPVNLSSYTTQTTTNLVSGIVEEELSFDGTQSGTNDPASQVGLNWDSANQFVLTYETRTQTSVFDMDGDGDVTFTNPVILQTQTIDLEGSDTGTSYQAIYVNGSIFGSNNDVPVSIASPDLTIFDLNDAELESATITLTNAQPGDQLNVDLDVLDDLGITATVTDNGTTIDVLLDGYALLANFETAIQSVTYSNSNPDGSFDRTTTRLITVDITDGIVSSTGATTQITFVDVTAANDPVASGNNTYVLDEDTPLLTNATNGLLADDSDPEGGIIGLVGGFDSLGNPIAIGSATILPSGSQIALAADGSFTFLPAPHFSGTEVVTYVVSDTTQNTVGYVTFNVVPVVDAVSLTVNQPTPASNEDTASAPVSIAAVSADPSETRIVEATNIPDGVIITDGTNEFQAFGFDNFVEITDWNLSQISVLPTQNSDADINVTFVTTNSEIDGSVSFDSSTVTFEIDAVADEPTVIVLDAGGMIDADVDLSSVISVSLFDTDGSEAITEVVVSNIPNGGVMLVNGVAQTINGGAVSLSLADIAQLTFRPPQTGANAIYNMQVSATATEVAPENTVGQATATRSGIGLLIDLNNDNDPVSAANDFATTFTGQQVAIPVLDNDFAPDGGAFVTQIDGAAISQLDSVTLAGGQGEVSINTFGQLVFEASSSFSGTVRFAYTVEDIDGSVDTALVTVDVLPSWSVTANPTVQEGDPITFNVTLDGSLQQGVTASVGLVLEDITTDFTDYGAFVGAVNDSITNSGQDGFSFDGTTLTYVGPDSGYTPSYTTGGSDFIDISSSGQELTLGADGLIQRNIGFSFPFYGDTFTNLFISADGYVTFGTPTAETDNFELDGTAFGGRPAIAAYWDALNQGTGSVFTETIGSTPGARQFVIQWNEVGADADPGSNGTFQIVLNEADGSVRINYDDVDFGGNADEADSASIGLENRNGSADSFSFNTAGAVESGSSILFNRGTVSNPTLTIALPTVDDPNFEPAEDVRLRLTGATGSAVGSNTATVSIDVSDNTAPVAVDDTLDVFESGSGSINLITNGAGADSDAENHALVLTQINGQPITNGDEIVIGSGAVLTANTTGVVNFNPNGQYAALPLGGTATETFTYTIDDGFGGTATATATVTIQGENEAPVFDLDDDGTTSTANNAIIVQQTDGAVAVTAPTAALLDVDDTTFVDLTIDMSGLQEQGFELFNILGQTFTLGTASTVTLTGGGTDFNVAYDGNRVFFITRDGGGEMPKADLETLARSITYENTSASNLPGIRTMTFEVNDGDDVGTSGTVDITVTGPNTVPVAGDDGLVTPFTTVEDTMVTIPSATLLANDFDPDGDPISIAFVSPGSGGTPVLNGVGDVEFTPGADFTGTAFFTYTLSDGLGGFATASVYIDVSPVNDAPRIDLNAGGSGFDFSVTYTENDGPIAVVDPAGSVFDVDSPTVTQMTVELTNGEIGDVFDLAGVPTGLSVSIVPPEATTGLTSAGSVTITVSGTASAADYTTALQAVVFENDLDNPVETSRLINVSASDGALVSAISTTSISVVGVNDDPVAVDDTASVDEDSFVILSDTLLLSNDLDGDMDTLTLTAVQGAVNGTVSLNPDNDAVFTPDPEYFGPASFSYTVDDGNGGMSIGLVTLTVNSVNDLPVLDLDTNTGGADFAAAYIEDGPAAPVVDPSVLITDSDTITLEGAVVSLANGQIGDVLRVAPLPIGISVFPANPMALTDAGPLTLTLSGTASLAEYQTALQAITFETESDTPPTLVRTVEIRVDDGFDMSNMATTLISVTPANDAPVAVTDIDLPATEDMVQVFTPADLLGNDFDPDGDAISLVSVGNAVNGAVVLNGDGTVSFTPDADFFGAASFDYTIEDPSNEQSTITANLLIASVNDIAVVDLDTVSGGTGFSTDYTENDPGVVLVGATSIADVDDTDMEQVTFTLSNGFAGDVLEVGGLPAGISASVVPATPLAGAGNVTVTLSGTASIADYEAAMAAVTYRSVSDNPSTAPRTITIVVNDGDDDANTTVTTVNVIAVNDDPVLTADGPFSTNEDEALVLAPAALLFNDTDPENDTLTLASVQAPVNGTVAINGLGNVVFTPDTNYSGPAEFTYTVTDGNGGTATATATIDVVSVNDVPQVDLDTDTGGTSYVTAYMEGAVGTPVADATVALFDVESGTLDGATLVLNNGHPGDVLEVGALPLGITHTITPSAALVVSGPVTVQLAGTASLADYELALQAVIYRSTSDNPSTDPRTVSVTVNDGEDDSAVATTTVLVSGVNDAPTANDDGPFTITEDQSFTLSATGLLFNDTDPEDDPRTIVSVQDAVNGTVVLNGDNTVTFTPGADYFGPASFTYTVEDPSNAQDTATVNLIVDPVNDAPEVDLDAALTGTGFSTVYNEGDTAILVTDPTVAVSDVDGSTIASATVTLTNGQIGDRLTVGSLPTGITAAVTPAGPLVVPGTTTVTLSGGATLADYELALQAVSFDSVSTNPSATTRMVSVVVSDGGASSTPAMTDITFNTVNDAPVAVADGPFTLDEDTPFARGQATFVFNDTDGEGDPLTITSVQDATNGTVDLTAGVVTFTPDADYSGPASFTYTVDDGNGGSNTGSVTLIIAAVNDAPVLDLDAVSGGGGYAGSYTENGVGVAVVDASVAISDVDNTTLFGASVTLTNGAVGDVLAATGLPLGITVSISPAMPLVVPGTATLTLSGAGSLADYQLALQGVTYASSSDNPDTADRLISIAVNDGAVNSASAMSVISVTATNDAPTSLDDGPLTVAEDTPLVMPAGSLTFNDSDAEGEFLTVTSVQDPVNGTVEMTAGTITFTPDADYSGPASFTYTVEDTNGAASTSTVSIDVTPVNDAAALDLDSLTAGTGSSVPYVENDAATPLVGGDVTLSDVDDTLIESAMVTLNNGQIGDMLEVGLLPAGLSFAVSPAGAIAVPGPVTVTLTGALPAADYETALQAITYRSTSDNINSTSRIVTFTVNDGDAASNAATVTVSITAVNDAPFAGDDGVFDTDEDTPLSLPAASLLFNDTDPENETLTLVSVQDAVNGSVVLTGGNAALFTPDVNYFGPASFTYTVEDATGAQTVATVSINVVSVNDLPVADLNTAIGGTGHTLTYVENDAPIAVVDASVTLSDADDTDLQSATVVLSNGFVGDELAVGALPTGLAATVSPSGPLAVDGSITVTLTGTATLLDYQTALQAVTFQSVSDDPAASVRSVTITVFDGDDASIAAATAIAINIVNDAPTGVADGPFSTDEDTDFTVQSSTLLFNDSDPEGDVLSVISVQAPVNGTVSMDGSGLITFVPDANYNGPASFNYTVRDANGATSDVTVDL